MAANSRTFTSLRGVSVNNGIPKHSVYRSSNPEECRQNSSLLIKVGGIPLTLGRVEGPTSVLKFLTIRSLLDTGHMGMEATLPENKKCHEEGNFVLIVMLGTHAHEGYSTHFVCVLWVPWWRSG